MTIIYDHNNVDSRTRLRRRRRKIKGTRREHLATRIRGPVVIAAICLVTALAGYIGVHDGALADTGLAFSAQAGEEVIFKDVMVIKGDTIWGIAADFSESSKDIRILVKEICALNDVKPGRIYPGQVLRVPVPAHSA